MSSAAHAYRTAADLPQFAGSPPPAWQDPSIVVSTGALPDGVAGEALLVAVQGAIDTWRLAECGAALQWVEHAGSADIDIEITWLSDWDGAGRAQSALASTDVTYSGSPTRGYTITQARIVLNAQHYAWSTSGESSASIGDVQATLTHELGHALGLLHVCEATGTEGAPRCSDDLAFAASVMYPDYSGLGQRTLSADDQAGLCALSASTPCDGSCNEPQSDGGSAAVHGVLGDPCEQNDQCADGLCTAAGYCSQRCSVAQTCPSTFVCPDPALGGDACVASLGVLGDRCSDPSQCTSALCLVSGGEGTCTRECSDEQACPAGLACKSLGERRVCRVRAARDGGCAVVYGSGEPALAVLMIFSILALLLGRRAERNGT